MPHQNPVLPARAPRAQPAPTPRSPHRRAGVDASGVADRDQSYAKAGARAAVQPADGRLMPSYVAAARTAGLLSTSPAPGETTPNPSTPLQHPVFFSGVSPGFPGIADAERHALRRLTFGPTLADRRLVQQNGLTAWIDAQLKPFTIDDPSATAVNALFRMITMTPREVIHSGDIRYQAPYQVAQATLYRQMFSTRQLYEIVVDVFANLLNVAMPGSDVNDNCPDWNHNVIRANALGRYEDMLVAAGRHPAMLQFLNNDQSNKLNVNENYGRELLELHTVGVASGYTESDVRNSAYILSGRTFDWNTGRFVYRADDHWTGAVRVMDFRRTNSTGSGGLSMGDAYLRYLANHPGTAQTVARKLAVRFVADLPPQSLVDRMAQTYLDSGTAIVPVLKVMLRSTEFWAALGQKTRRPAEDVVGTVRALGVTQAKADAAGGIYWAVQGMGNAPLGWVPPNGYPDVAAAWRSAIGLVQRWNAHRALAAGWWSLKPARNAGDELRDSTGMTWQAYFDKMAIALLGQRMTAAHRTALAQFLGVQMSNKVDANQAWKAPFVKALILDSPYFQLR